MTPGLSDAVRLLADASRIVIVSHVKPDSDAIGSTLGLGLALMEMGKEVRLLNADPLPHRVKFLPHIGLISDSLTKDYNFDLLVVVDSSDAERIGEAFKPLLDRAPRVLVIDHHVTNTRFGTINVVDDECSSTSEVLIGLLDELPHPLSPDVATCLGAGMVGDTIMFSIPSVSPQTFRAAARLLESGANLSEINTQLLNTYTLDEIRLWGLGLTNMALEHGVIWSEIRFARRADALLNGVDRTRLVNVLLSVADARIAASFSENPDGTVEISMRARPGHDVAKIAFSLGGGGHTLAAGCTIDGPFDAAVARVVALMKAEAGLLQSVKG